jgi:peptidoglycan/xylan/chitin deacetylase (PgdA/CDA1 family)
MRAALTVDVEPDCPPYLTSFRGIDEGLPRLLTVLQEAGVSATFFMTGEVARRSPQMVRRLLAEGHELGCHGDTHRNFARLDAADARREIRSATATLRGFGPVTAFRAPFLAFPERYLEFLRDEGYAVDSSTARYKWPFRRPAAGGRLARIPVSTTSSTLRWPPRLRDMILRRLASPVVLFVHPWEFCDFRRDRRLRLDCRFKTVDGAVQAVRETIAWFRRRDVGFRRLTELVEADGDARSG